MAIDAKQEVQSVIIPFLGSLQERLETSGTTPYTDQYFKNGNFWELTNYPTGKKTYQWVSRPGYILEYENTSGVTSDTKAIYSWRGGVYSVTNTRLLKNGVEIAVIPATSSNTNAQFTETRVGATTPYLCYNTGSYLVLVDTSDDVTIISSIQVTSVSAANPAVVTTTTNHGLSSGVKVILRDVSGSTPDINDTAYTITVTSPNTFTIPVNVTVAGSNGNLGSFPANTLGTLVYMDTYIFTNLTTGPIYNCAPDDPTLWNSSWVITPQMYPGQWRAIARQNNFLLAFSDTTIQTFVTTNNSSGAPLENYESGAQQLGCVRANSIASDGQRITWVGTTQTGQATVYMMEGLTSPQEIATTQIKNLMASNYGNGKASFIRTAGKNLYLLMSTEPDILVYDYDLNMWVIWERAVDTTAAEWVAFAAYQEPLNNPPSSVLFLLEYSGDIYRFTPEESTDRNMTATPGGGTAFEVAVQTERLDFQTTNRKFVRRLELLADKTATTANVMVSYSDDDYSTFSTERALDLSNSRAFLPLGGNFRRRAYKFSYTGTQRIRWQGFELFFRFGKS